MHQQGYVGQHSRGYQTSDCGVKIQIKGHDAKYAMRLAFTANNQVRIRFYTADMEHSTEVLVDKGKEPYWPTYLVPEVSASKARDHEPFMGAKPITKPLHALLKRGPTVALKEQSSGSD